VIGTLPAVTDDDDLAVTGWFQVVDSQTAMVANLSQAVISLQH
jgi:hypothetical protein